VIFVAFHLIEHDGDDLCERPMISRKRLLAKLIGKTKIWRAIQYGDHLIGDGPAIFDHVCQLGLEGIVSKHVDSFYRSGPSKVWVKAQNSASAAVRREREEEWRWRIRLLYRCVHRHDRPAGAVRTFSYAIDRECIAALVSRCSAVPEARYVELP
jgi:ATP dependent DNA ligase domain